MVASGVGELSGETDRLVLREKSEPFLFVHEGARFS
jgi:hypothetical protein